MKYISLAMALVMSASPLAAQKDTQKADAKEPQIITIDMSGLNFGKTKITDAPITASGPMGDLAGSYIDAGQDTPVVLIIAGSGPTDRNGNSPLGINANSYQLLAKALAAKNISSVRSDKRGMFSSAAAIKDANAVTIADYASDVQAWSETIRAKTNQPCIWIAGHSEGGLVALAAAQSPDNICGIITIAAAGRPLDIVLREQLDANPANAPILPDAYRAIDTLKTGKTIDVSTMHPALQGLFNPAVQPYMIDLFSYDPAALAAQTQHPLIIIQGDNDIQVSVKDAKILAKSNAKAQLHIIPKMNHVLKHIDSNDRTINAQSYANPDLPISPQLVDIIAGFIQKKPVE